MRTDPRGVITTYAYDPAGQLTNRRYLNDPTVTFTYDGNGNRLTMQDGSGTAAVGTQYTYDALNRTKSVDNQFSKTVNYGYDAVGQRTSMSLATVTGLFSYQYDGAGRLIKLTNPQGDVTTFGYDTANRRTGQTQANGVGTSYSYDGADRLTQLASATPAGSPLTSFSYRYDHTVNRLGVTEVDGSLITWSYDRTYQLTNESGAVVPSLDWVDFTLPQWQAFTLPQWQTFTLDATSGSGSTTYTYDPVGNRLIKNASGALTTSVYDAANQLKTSVSSSGVTTFTYDLAGNQHIQQAPTGVTTSTWNNENRRTLVALPSGVLNTFSYNGDGLRAQLQNSTGGSRMVWDGRAYLAETSTGNVVVTEYTQEPSAYGGLISRTNAGATLYYLLDGLGSTSKLTNASAVITDAYSYTAFGEPVSTIGAGSVNPFRWVGTLGYYFDLDLLEYYLRARTYDPVLARFLAQDPIGFTAGDGNQYRYVLNSPIILTDPSGSCIVCGSRISYHEQVAQLDSFAVGTPYSNLITTLIRPSLTNQQFYPGTLNTPVMPVTYGQIASAGLYTGVNDPFSLYGTPIAKGVYMAGRYVFFISIAYCDGDDPCLFELNEGGSKIKWTGPAANKVRTDKGPANGFAPLGPPNTEKSTLKIAWKGGCKKLFVFADAPGAVAIKNEVGFVQTIKQTLRVSDSTGTTAEISHGLTFGVTANFRASAITSGLLPTN